MYLLKSNDEAFSTFVEFQTRVEKQLGRLVKKLRADRGREYQSKKAKAYLKKHGVIAEMTAPYSPQSNGIGERKNNIFTEMVTSVLITSSVPTCYWADALLMAK